MKYIITILLLASCTTTKTKTQNLEKTQKTTSIDTLYTQNKTSIQTQEIKNQVCELKNIIANLNINYTGKNLDDKLDVLLKQTNQGTKLTISGVGTANFKETSNNHIKTLQTQILKHYDSLHSEQLQEIKSLKTEIKQEITTQQKQSNPTYLNFWALPIIALILLALKQYIKPFF